jgi:ubiquinone/menaquinone biosynthesis C-methylase UbiE
MIDSNLYERRFDPAEREAKARVWRVLCEDFFQRYVSPSDAVLDLGAGFCEFINHIRCGAKWAVDSDEQVRAHAGPDVEVRCAPAHDLSWLDAASADVVFASNFFEHMPNKDALVATLREVHRVLKTGGRLLVLQPNIRYAYKEYWDFFDHHVPLSDKSMAEVLETNGFEVTEARPRFLPYTTKSALPQWPLLVRLYLRMPLAQRILGKQMFLVARKR